MDCSPWGRKELGMTELAHSTDMRGCVTGAEHGNMKERYKPAESFHSSPQRLKGVLEPEKGNPPEGLMLTCQEFGFLS